MPSVDPEGGSAWHRGLNFKENTCVMLHPTCPLYRVHPTLFLFHASVLVQCSAAACAQCTLILVWEVYLQRGIVSSLMNVTLYGRYMSECLLAFTQTYTVAYRCVHLHLSYIAPFGTQCIAQLTEPSCFSVSSEWISLKMFCHNLLCIKKQTKETN